MTEDEAFDEVIAFLENQRGTLSRALDRAELQEIQAPSPYDAIRYKQLKNDIRAELARVRSNILVLNLNKPSMLAAHAGLKALAEFAVAESKSIQIATANANELSKILQATTRFVEGVGKLVGVFS